MSPENGYKETILGSLPIEWDVVHLGEVASFRTKPTGIKLPPVIPFIPMEFVPQGKTFIEIFELRDKVSSGTYCENGDILLPKITPSFENGKQGIVGNIPGGFCYATTEVLPIETSPFLDGMFLFFYFLHKPIRRDLAGKMEGTTGRQRIPKPVVLEMVLPLPPLPEQRAIAHVLSTVRQSIEATERVIAAARELKRSMMKYLFTYGPVPINQADQVVLKEMEIGEVPVGWEVVMFGNVVDIISGQVDPRKMPYRDMLHIGPENIEEATGRLLPLNTAGELSLKSGKYLFSPEEVVYSKIRPYLKKAAMPDFVGICSADMYPLHPKEEKLVREFLFHYLLSDIFSSQAIPHQLRTGIPKINRVQLNSTYFPVPSISTQKKIASYLSIVDRKIEKEMSKMDALEALFNSLLHHLMTGKVRVASLLPASGSEEVGSDP